MRRRAWQFVSALLMVLVLGGCSSIPDSGPVEAGLPDLQQVAQTIKFNPPGPAPGATQEDIVRGFVLAATSSENDYSVARQYLTKAYANQWDPYYGVQVDDGQRSYRKAANGVGLLSLDLVANVDEFGEMRAVPPGPRTDQRFELLQVGGQWRIASAPNGIILDRSDFLAIWSPHELSFLGAGGYLVPETRWYLTGAALATEIVNGLVEGPGTQLRESVRTAFPPGSRLVSDSVTVVDGHARIDFTGALLNASPGTLDEVAAQLSASLRLVQGVTSFELLVDGVLMREDTANLRVDLRPKSQIVNAVVNSRGKFGELVGENIEALPGMSEAVVSLKPSAVTMALDGKAAAVLSAGGVSRVDAEGVVPIDTREGLLQPSFDAMGNIWTISLTAPTNAQVTKRNGDVVRVQLPWLEGRSVAAVRLSPDGSRIAALVDAGGKSVVLVAGVERTELGFPLRTTDEADEQMWVPGEPVDFDWIDQARFAALSLVDDASLITVGGPGLLAADQGFIVGGQTISGGGTRAQLRVLGSKGTLFASQGSAWQGINDEIDLLAKRG